MYVEDEQSSTFKIFKLCLRLEIAGSTLYVFQVYRQLR